MAKTKKKTMTIGEVGFAMKFEASLTTGENLIVSKTLWLQIAELLMQTDRNLKEIEKTLKEYADGGGING